MGMRFLAPLKGELSLKATEGLRWGQKKGPLVDKSAPWCV